MLQKNAINSTKLFKMYKIQFNKKKNDQSEKNDCHLLITHIIYIKTKILL